jgi:DNA segregation ATPase FtsK/SpoIIIE-like protein
MLLALCVAASLSLLTWSAADPSFIRSASGATRNALGPVGANVADIAMRLLGLAAVSILLPPLFWALQLITRRHLEEARMKAMLAPVAALLLASAASALPSPAAWPLPYGLGGFLGDQTLRFLAGVAVAAGPERAPTVAGLLCLAAGLPLLVTSLGMSFRDLVLVLGRPRLRFLANGWRRLVHGPDRGGAPAFVRREPMLDVSSPQFADTDRTHFPAEPAFDLAPPLGRAVDSPPAPSGRRVNLRRPIAGGARREVEREADFDRTTEARSQDMARRFAPSRDEPAGPFGFGMLRRRAGQPRQAGAERQTGRRPVWPGSVPAAAAAEQDALGPGEASDLLRDVQEDELYGRALAVVRAHREASIVDLKQRLGIRFMQAAVLMDRMEREGIVGPPARNGGRRPIRGLPGRPRTV